MTSLEECSNNSTLGSTLPRTMKGKPQTEKQRGQGACAKQRLHQRGHEGASWRSCGGQGRTLEAVDHSCDSWKLLQRFTSHRLRARSGNARSMEEACRYKEARRATREQLAPMGALGRPVRQEHVDAVLAFAGAGQRRRLFRVLDILTDQSAAGDLHKNDISFLTRNGCS